MTITSSGIAHGTNLQQTADREFFAPYNWFSLHDNDLTGKYKLLNGQQVGAWSNVIGDANGDLPSPFTITNHFDNNYAIQYLRVVGDSQANIFPVDFTIKLYNPNNVLIDTITVVDNTNAVYDKVLTAPEEVREMVLEVTKVNKPNVPVRILEFNWLPYEIFLKETVHELMRASQRYVKAYVEIVYSDPLFKATKRITANTAPNGAYTNQLNNGETDINTRWFKLYDNDLTGAYRVIPEQPDHAEIGWWSGELAKADGTFNTDPVLTMEFDPQDVYSFIVAGGKAENIFPVDYTIKLYRAGVVAYTQHITDNNEYYHIVEFSKVENISKIEIEIHKINQGNKPAVIAELSIAIVERYYEDDIEFIKLLEEKVRGTATVFIGNLSSNKLTVRLENKDDKFNPVLTSKKLSAHLKRNRRIRAFLGTEHPELGEVWFPLGTFWSTKWNVKEQSPFAEVQGLDRLELLRSEIFEESPIYQNTDVYYIVDSIMKFAKVPVNNYRIHESFKQLVIPLVWFERKSFKDALQLIAEVAQAQVYVDRYDIIQFTPYDANNKATLEFSWDDFIGKEFPNLLNAQVNTLEVTMHEYALGEDKDNVLRGQAHTLKGSTEREILIAYAKSPTLVRGEPSIDNALVKIKQWASYAWGIKITLENTDVNEQQFKITLAGNQFVKEEDLVFVIKDEKAIAKDGPIRLDKSINNPFIQTQERAEAIGQSQLRYYQIVNNDCKINSFGTIVSNLGDKLRIPLVENSDFTNYVLTRQDMTWDGSLRANIQGRLL